MAAARSGAATARSIGLRRRCGSCSRSKSRRPGACVCVQLRAHTHTHGAGGGIQRGRKGESGLHSTTERHFTNSGCDCNKQTDGRLKAKFYLGYAFETCGRWAAAAEMFQEAAQELEQGGDLGEDAELKAVNGARKKEAGKRAE
eukprot:SAG22_NODE_12732_length_431_cov_1.000000_1_plen_143_part_11